MNSIRHFKKGKEKDVLTQNNTNQFEPFFQWKKISKNKTNITVLYAIRILKSKYATFFQIHVCLYSTQSIILYSPKMNE